MVVVFYYYDNYELNFMIDNKNLNSPLAYGLGLGCKVDQRGPGRPCGWARWAPARVILGHSPDRQRSIGDRDLDFRLDVRVCVARSESTFKYGRS